MARKRLGEILLEDGLIDEQDLAEALKYKEQSGYRLGTALVALRIIGEWQLTEALGKALELPVVDLATNTPSPTALKRIPARLAERFDLVPLRIEGRGKTQQLVVAMSDPLNRSVIKRMEGVAGCPVQPVLAGLSAIQRAIRQHYHHSESKVFDEAARMGSAQKNIAGVAGPAGTAAEDSTAENDFDFEESTKRNGEARRGRGSARDKNIESLQALNYKFRAMLHLLLRRQLFSEREFTETLRNIMDASERKSRG